MMDQAQAPMESPEMAQETTGTFEVPLKVLGGREVKPGDKLGMTVTAVDPESGMMSCTYDAGEAETPAGGSDSLAKAFGSSPPTT